MERVISQIGTQRSSILQSGGAWRWTAELTFPFYSLARIRILLRCAIAFIRGGLRTRCVSLCLGRDAWAWGTSGGRQAWTGNEISKQTVANRRAKSCMTLAVWLKGRNLPCRAAPLDVSRFERSCSLANVQLNRSCDTTVERCMHSVRCERGRFHAPQIDTISRIKSSVDVRLAACACQG